MSVDYIDYGFNNGKVIEKLSNHARKKFFEQFRTVMEPKESDLILDSGVTPNNAPASSNFFEKLYPWTERITMCSIENASNLEQIFRGSKFVRNEPGKALPFADNQFDIVFCNAVLEHVGDDEAQKFFLSELLRVGKSVYCTTPNRWFPIEVHTVLPFLHWFPRPVHQKLLKILGKNFYAKTENLNLLSKRKLNMMLASIKKSSQPFNWTFSSYKLLGWTSNIILIIKKKS